MGSGKLYIRYLSGILVMSLGLPGVAFAYVGPGAGISMLGALWGLIIGVLMAVGVILFWPIRMMIRKAKAKKAGSDEQAGTEAQSGSAETRDSAETETSGT